MIFCYIAHISFIRCGLNITMSVLVKYFIIKRAGALAFDMEYARWLEEQNRQAKELRAAANSHASDDVLRVIVDDVMKHYDELFRIKSVAAKADVFHILSGMWMMPAERCFLWLGGFRSSELLKVQIFCFSVLFLGCLRYRNI